MKKNKKDLEKEIEVEEAAVEVEQNEELLALQEENTKLKNEFLRAYADAENVKKRCQQEIEKNNKYAVSSFGKELLTVADNLDRALASAEGEEKTGLLEGVELTRNELTRVFNKFGITKMDIMGKIFDANFHQVVQEVEDKTKPAGTVINELQSGYMINDRILREAMVVVSK